MIKTLMFPFYMLRWAHTIWAMRYVCPASPDYLELIHIERTMRERLDR